jgi:dihydroorotate dehydrogenase (NAD+) catalytic subunit
MSSMTCEVAGILLNNPIIMASGTFGYGQSYAELYPLDKLGGIVTKGLTLYPRLGNEGARLLETASGLLNSIGLENPGITSFLEHELDVMTERTPAIIVNLGGSTIEEYVDGATLITDACRARQAEGLRGIDLIELNISCPNVKEGGIQYGMKTEKAREVVRSVRAVTALPLLIKLSPSAENIVEMAAMCQEEGADGLSLVNTIQAMAIDIRRRRSYFHNLYAGLSGPAIKPIALRMVHQVTSVVSIPVIGIGGISSAEDILEFIMAGAAAVQIGTYNFANLRAGATLPDELQALMKKEHINCFEEIRGIV